MQKATKNSGKVNKSHAKARGVATNFKVGNFLESLSSTQLRKADLPDFKAGDKVVVKSKVKEGDKERVQAFEGVVIARQGRGIAETFTVRKVSGGVGVERIYPLHSPNVVGVELMVQGKVRRSKLYYIRELAGKKARIKDKNEFGPSSSSSAVSGDAKEDAEA